MKDDEARALLRRLLDADANGEESLLRAAADVCQAARAFLATPAAPAAPAEPVAWTVLCNGMFTKNVFGSRADAVATMLRLDAVHHEDSREVAPLYAAPPEAEDAARLEWLARMVSGAELRRIGVVWGDFSRMREAIDAARRAQEG